MPISVNFKTQKGEVNNRKFAEGEGVSVYGTFKSYLFNDFNAKIRIDLLDINNNSIFFDEKNTNFWGDYDFWFRTPDSEGKYIVKIIGTHSGGGIETLIIPIAVGNVIPDKLPNPKPEKSLFDLFDSGNLILILVLLLLIIGGFIYLSKQ